MAQRSVHDIRKEVESSVGKEVILKADMGRKRVKTKTGVIVDAFPSVFTVKVNNDFDVERVVSYTYSDILTSTVKLTPNK
ncbi:Veg family protein [Anaerococcus sp. NML200574]|uniref:Veg family protein n=2 Tax=Anaerococcus TaxID=165779 RepID=UPI002236F804|nr:MULTISPECIES: Veg family protein [unclassified Anaerococcus]MCW6678639.1 Veg family protein [Anaerococcus sp. NML200574]MCW6700737.1 Veg family protein [Anaerococcus sp. NML200537]